MRITSQQLGNRAVWVLPLLLTLWTATLPESATAARTTMTSIGHSLELPLRDLSSWLAPPRANTRRPPVTLGLRN